MSGKKTKQRRSAPTPQRKPEARPAGGDRRKLVFGVVATAVVVVAAVVALANRSPETPAVAGVSGSTVTTAVASGPATAPPEEQKYIGRYLPAGYQEPTVQPVSYSAATQMTDVAADASSAQLTVPVADVQAGKIVAFSYTKSDGSSIPLIAYVKPSGQVFAGVSYCIPCQGTRQFVDADGTLTCNSCGTKRDLSTGVGLSGPCRLYPLDELPATVNADKLVVDKSILDQWTPQPKDRPVG